MRGILFILLLCVSIVANATALYRIGSGGDWTSTSNWSTTDGGGSCSCAPGSTDDAYFTSNSGGGSITFSSNPTVGSLTLTGAPSTTISLATRNLTLEGNFVGDGAGNVSFTATSGQLRINGSGSNTFTQASTILNANVSFGADAGASVTHTLMDNLALGGNKTLDMTNTSGTGDTLDANGYNVTAYKFTSTSTTTPRTLHMGSGTWTFYNSSGVQWQVGIAGSNFTLDAGTSKIVLTNPSGSGVSFLGGGYTYYDLDASAVNGINFAANESNTFHTVTLGVTAGTAYLTFYHGTTTTATTWNLVGSATYNITIGSDDSANQATIAKAGGGVVSGDYLDVAYSVASPANTFYAGTHSTDGGNNTNWTFTAPPAPSTNIQSIMGLTYGSVSSVMGVSTANMKSFDGLQ